MIPVNIVVHSFPLMASSGRRRRPTGSHNSASGGVLLVLLLLLLQQVSANPSPESCNVNSRSQEDSELLVSFSKIIKQLQPLEDLFDIVCAGNKDAWENVHKELVAVSHLARSLKERIPSKLKEADRTAGRQSIIQGNPISVGTSSNVKPKPVSLGNLTPFGASVGIGASNKTPTKLTALECQTWTPKINLQYISVLRSDMLHLSVKAGIEGCEETVQKELETDLNCQCAAPLTTVVVNGTTLSSDETPLIFSTTTVSTPANATTATKGTTVSGMSTTTTENTIINGTITTTEGTTGTGPVPITPYRPPPYTGPTTTRTPYTGPSTSTTTSVPYTGPSTTATTSVPYTGPSTTATTSVPYTGPSTSTTTSVPYTGPTTTATTSKPYTGPSTSTTTRVPYTGPTTTTTEGTTVSGATTTESTILNGTTTASTGTTSNETCVTANANITAEITKLNEQMNDIQNKIQGVTQALIECSMDKNALEKAKVLTQALQDLLQKLQGVLDRLATLQGQPQARLIPGFLRSFNVPSLRGVYVGDEDVNCAEADLSFTESFGAIDLALEFLAEHPTNSSIADQLYCSASHMVDTASQVMQGPQVRQGSLFEEVNIATTTNANIDHVLKVVEKEEEDLEARRKSLEKELAELNAQSKDIEQKLIEANEELQQENTE